VLLRVVARFSAHADPTTLSSFNMESEKTNVVSNIDY
jgi:hypothetical protein